MAVAGMAHKAERREAAGKEVSREAEAACLDAHQDAVESAEVVMVAGVGSEEAGEEGVVAVGVGMAGAGVVAAAREVAGRAARLATEVAVTVHAQHAAHNRS